MWKKKRVVATKDSCGGSLLCFYLRGGEMWVKKKMTNKSLNTTEFGALYSRRVTTKEGRRITICVQGSVQKIRFSCTNHLQLQFLKRKSRATFNL